MLNGQAIFREAETRHILAANLKMGKPVHGPDPGTEKTPIFKEIFCLFYNLQQALDNFLSWREPGGKT